MLKYRARIGIASNIFYPTALSFHLIIASSRTAFAWPIPTRCMRYVPVCAAGDYVSM